MYIEIKDMRQLYQLPEYSDNASSASAPSATSSFFSCWCYACTMFERRKYRRIFIVMLLVFIFGLIYLGYFMCEDRVCVMGNKSKHNQFDAYITGKVISSESFKPTDLHREYEFNIEGSEVLVFLHIQKTGGTTFGKHLVKNLDLEIPCECHKGKKRCICHNSQHRVWLFSRYSTGWLCGLHADWTELQACVHARFERMESVGPPRNRRYNRYLYITILRDPVRRYLSEWRHVQRGSTWLSAGLKCNGRQATLEQVPFCFTEEDWSGVSLDEFLSCPHNLAHNRQTRMLANLSLIGCYNKSVIPDDEVRNQLMLQSAKDNLRDMAFFGLTEHQADTQYMFERTFHLKFLEDFVQYNVTHANLKDISPTQRERIYEKNRLDIELYQYAKQLFFQRLKRMRVEDKGNSAPLSDNREGVGDNRVIFQPNSHSSSNTRVSDKQHFTDIHKYDDERINKKTPSDVHNSNNKNRAEEELDGYESEQYYNDVDVEDSSRDRRHSLQNSAHSRSHHAS